MTRLFRSYLLILLFSLFSVLANAQHNRETDSLKALIQAASQPKERAKLYSDLCWAYISISIDSSLHYGHQAVTLASGTNDQPLIAQARNDYGTALLLNGQIEPAIQQYLTAKKIRQTLGDENGTASILLKLGNCYYKTGQLDSAMQQFTAALRYYEKENKAFETAQVQGNIGALYYTMGNYQKSLDYHQQSAALLESLKRPYEFANAVVNIGNTYLKQKDTSAALVEYRKAEGIARDASNKYAQSAALNNISNILVGKHQFKEAINYAEQTIALREQLGMAGELASGRTTLAIAYNATGAYRLALSQLDLARPVAEKNGISEQLVSIYLQKAIAHGALHQTDSLHHYMVLYETTKNKYTDNEMLKASAELETKYQSERKDATLEKNKTAIRFRNFAIGGISLLLVLVLIIAALVTKQQKLKARQQELARLNDQRSRISRELHDNIGTYLTFIKSSIEQVETPATPNSPTIQDVKKLTEETIAELRKTVWLMNNPELHLADFRAKLADYYKKIPAVQMQTAAQSGNPALNTQTATHLFRIVQEAVTNALKHATADTVLVFIDATQHELKVLIADNGVGFATENPTDGQGISNIRERVHEMQGTFQIGSITGTGTRVEIIIPLRT